MRRVHEKRGMQAVILGACLLMAEVSLAQGAQPKSVAMMTTDERLLMTGEMQQVLDEAFSGRALVEDYPWPLAASVSLDVPGNMIIVDFDARLAEYVSLSESEDMADYVYGLLWSFLERIEGQGGIRFLYGGRAAQDVPQDDPTSQVTQVNSRRKRNVDAQLSVVVAPGHGFYYHGKFKDWRAQREPANGVLEDDLTPVLAGHLEHALRLDGMRAETLRAGPPTTEHSASKQPWWRLGVRYQLEQRFPQLSDVWQSPPSKPLISEKKVALKERDEDIRSRPLYANHVGASALIHVHTNAHESPSTSGLRVYTNGRSEDKNLASKVLCGAKELIRANEKFKAYNVAGAPSFSSDHAENNLAKMPSVIVEVGFHTNPQDAAFLKDREFQVLAMRGVAKGYRLYRNKRPCEEFAVNPVEQVTGRVGIDVRIPFDFKGNPVYPIRVWSKDEKCTGRGCHSKDKTLSGPRDFERFKVQFLCKREDVVRSPIELRVGARDFDNVVAKPATYKVVCTP
jgi:N-acetylmuramoyl-L-alanine amidase